MTHLLIIQMLKNPKSRFYCLVGVFFMLGSLVIPSHFVNTQSNSLDREFFGLDGETLGYRHTSTFTTSYTTEEIIVEKYEFSVIENSSTEIVISVQQYVNKTLEANLNWTNSSHWKLASIQEYTLTGTSAEFLNFLFILPKNVFYPRVLTPTAIMDSSYITTFDAIFEDDTQYIDEGYSATIENRSAQIEWDIRYTQPHSIYREYQLNVSLSFEMNLAKVLTTFEYGTVWVEDFFYMQNVELESEIFELVYSTIEEPEEKKRIGAYPIGISLSLLSISFCIEISIFLSETKKNSA